MLENEIMAAPPQSLLISCPAIRQRGGRLQSAGLGNGLSGLRSVQSQVLSWLRWSQTISDADIIRGLQEKWAVGGGGRRQAQPRPPLPSPRKCAFLGSGDFVCFFPLGRGYRMPSPVLLSRGVVPSPQEHHELSGGGCRRRTAWQRQQGNPGSPGCWQQIQWPAESREPIHSNNCRVI